MRHPVSTPRRFGNKVAIVTGAAAASIEPYVCDMTDSAAVCAMAAACVSAFGTIDVLVNNVGGSAAGGPVEMSEAVWDCRSTST